MTYAEFEKVLLEAIRSEALDDVVDYTPPLIARARSNYSDRLRVSVYRFDREDKAFYYRDHFKDIYDTPSSYNVEASSRCFLRCRMCTFQREVRRKKTKPFIDWELYKRIVDQIYETRKNKPTSICLIYRGEPLLNRNLAQMVEHASKFGFKVGIASNGILLTKDKARELLRAGLGWIDFSIDAASKDTYDKIRIGGNYDKAVENVENFVSVRDELGSKTEVGLKFVLQELNELEVNAFLDRWIDVVDNVTVQSEIKKDGDGQFGMRALKKNFMPQARPPCSVFWQNMIITTEGLVVPCINSTGEIVLGDVNHNSLYEIWHNEEFVKCRELHLAGRFDELELCRNCDAVLSDMTPYLIEEKNGFSKAIYSCVEVYSKTGKSK
ncbi:MAG: radical SAM/SPASM domain-containing protein [bacterium]